MSNRLDRIPLAIFQRGRCAPVPMTRETDGRDGFLMLVVCVLLLILISAAYLFSERMLISNVASTGALQARQANSLSESGIAYTRAKIQSAFQSDQGKVEWPEQWTGEVRSTVPRSDQQDKRDQLFGEFQVSCWDHERSAWIPGVADESCKLNLNHLPLDKLYAPEARRMLMCIPRMTLAIADSILDWMDEDEEQREFGAESSYYQSKSAGAKARNQRLEQLEDLLGVRGMTPELLYGSRASSPWSSEPIVNFPLKSLDSMSSSSGRERLGFSAFLTVNGGPSVYRADGEKKVLVNQDDLVQLFDDLERVLGEDIATYVVAYRMVGPKDKTILVKDEFALDAAEQTRQRAAQQRGENVESEQDASALTRVEQRGPLMIDTDGGFLVRSAYDLVGVSVEYQSEDGSLLLESPWPENDYTFDQLLPKINEQLSFVLGTPVLAQVNVNQSPEQVLFAVPGMLPDVVNRIVTSRDQLGIYRYSSEARISGKQYMAIDWLRRSGTLDLKEMRLFAPYFTNVGNAFHFMSTGISHPNKHHAHREIILDFRYKPSRVVFARAVDSRSLLTSEVAAR